MAEHSMTVETSSSTDFDFEEHEKTYHRVVSLIKWASGAAIVLMIFLFWLWYH